jgi:two-component system nitrogen regulation response regulator GlnG
VGKELVARAIHSCSRRAYKSFVALDCATIPDSLVESELFGYERGAFTGATARREGYFSVAHGGTVFLDEVVNLSSEAQKKLLRAIQERKVQPLGGKKSVEFDARFVAACNIPLEISVKSRKFRKDLYYRLNEFSLYIPPLRERKKDIVYLAQKFLRETALELERRIDGFSCEAVELLKSYHYPGNVRELRNIVKQAALVCDKRVEAKNLHFLMPGSKEVSGRDEHLMGLEEGLSMKEISKRKAAEVERKLIRYALDRCRGNKMEASRLLKIDYKTLFNKLKEYNIAL